MAAGGLAAILGKGPSAPADEDTTSESEAVAQDIIDAIQDGNAVALDAALKAHYEECQMDASDEDLESDEYPDEE